MRLASDSADLDIFTVPSWGGEAGRRRGGGAGTGQAPSLCPDSGEGVIAHGSCLPSNSCKVLRVLGSPGGTCSGRHGPQCLPRAP